MNYPHTIEKTLTLVTDKDGDYMLPPVWSKRLKRSKGRACAHFFGEGDTRTVTFMFELESDLKRFG